MAPDSGHREALNGLCESNLKVLGLEGRLFCEHAFHDLDLDLDHNLLARPSQPPNTPPRKASDACAELLEQSCVDLRVGVAAQADEKDKGLV